MKSGKRIYRAVVAADDQAKRLRRLGKGSLRSLMLHASSPPVLGTDAGGEVMALAMCELTRRFLDRGKEVL